MKEVTLIPPAQLDELYGHVELDEIQDVLTELKELHEKLRASEGQMVLDLTGDLGRSRKMLARNKRDLIQAIRAFENDFSAGNFTDEDEILNALMEFSRSLHNYLAMVHSVRDHAYRVLNKLDDDDLRDQYTTKLQETGLAKRGSFVADLRNYVQHRRVPVVTGRIQSHGTNQIIFDREKLATWNDWSSDGQERLMEMEEEFEIEDEIESYQSINETFYDWFISTIGERYVDEIKERDEIIEEIVQIQQDKLINRS
ncbi:hypothetical protein [Haloferax sp. KTX1]|uniref:hypothetical protein n=1 Tax=Haloferax sp. KTX1 TaxID=2600597 RepID=UPI0011DCC167|nr:hypothetical protein [Haloferax sp. KTX1]